MLRRDSLSAQPLIRRSRAITPQLPQCRRKQSSGCPVCVQHLQRVTTNPGHAVGGGYDARPPAAEAPEGHAWEAYRHGCAVRAWAQCMAAHIYRAQTRFCEVDQDQNGVIRSTTPRAAPPCVFVLRATVSDFAVPLVFYPIVTLGTILVGTEAIMPGAEMAGLLLMGIGMPVAIAISIWRVKYNLEQMGRQQLRAIYKFRKSAHMDSANYDATTLKRLMMKMFFVFDADGSGEIDARELRLLMSKAYFDVPEEVLQKIIFEMRQFADSDGRYGEWTQRPRPVMSYQKLDRTKAPCLWCRHARA
eukprot:4462199-Prymnesium_polylepis.2